MPRVSLRTSIMHDQLRRNRPNNISGWKYISIEPKGTRAKKILQRDNATFLFKEPNDDFEIVTEVFNSILANELEINHVQYFPAKYQDKYGVVCRRFLKDSPQVEELVELKEILYRHSQGLQKYSLAEFDKMKGRDKEAVAEQSIDNLYMVLEEEGGEAILRDFFKMIGFDALIGHTDRHWENYGIWLGYTKRKRLFLRFAPIYDTVSSFLAGTPDSQVEKHLTAHLKKPDWYRPKRDDNCKIKVPGNAKCNHFDLMEYIANSDQLSVYMDELFWTFERFDRKVAAEILKRFFPDLSNIRKSSIIEILVQRHKIGAAIRDRM